MNKEFIKKRYEICIRGEEIIPFFKEKVIPVLEKIKDIELPYLFFCAEHELVQLEYEKVFNKDDKNIVSIEFYKNGEAEIYFIKRRIEKTIKIPMDEVKLKYDKVAEYIDTVCRDFITDNSDKTYQVRRIK